MKRDILKIEGWAIWNEEEWVTEYWNLYPSKEAALEAAKQHYVYPNESDWHDDMVVLVTINMYLLKRSKKRPCF